MTRRRLNTPALLGALAGALIAVATMAHADDGEINALIGADDIGTGHATAPADTGAATAPAVPGGIAAPDGAERWLAADGPIGALSVITVHPLPGDGCQNVLFDMRPSQRVRHEAVAGEEMELGLGDLCLFGIRNDSDDRAIAIRLGEELRTVAIGIDSRLQSGLTIGPGHEVLTPIRPLSLDEVRFSVEVVWDDLIDSGKAEASAFHVLMTSDPSNGS
ncbi:MAG: hypothetical protein R3D59_05350 [Paracoccaceae bacterium]|nr:hypothetical protein [Maritimibacter sp.]